MLCRAVVDFYEGDSQNWGLEVAVEREGLGAGGWDG